MLTRFIQAILDANSVEDIKKPYLGAIAELGFENVFYAARFMLALPSSLTPEHTVVISNVPESTQRQLTGPDKPGCHLWADWVFRNDGDISLAALVAAENTDPSSAMLAARRNGLDAWQIISLRDKVRRSIGAVLVNPYVGASHADVDRCWQRSAPQVRTLSWVTHMRLATLPPEDVPPRLTARQREVLEWRSAGKTISEVATILGVTPATVEKHMRLAREAMGVQTTAQAILKAHIANELFPQWNAENPFR